MISQPKFWKNRNFVSDILLPLSFFYLFINSFKNYFEKKFKSKLTIICVGNLTIGGSGKTPTVIYIAELLKTINYNVTILLKGYGGVLKGPLRVTQKNKSSDVGDEALLHSRINETWISNIRSKGVQLIEGVDKKNNLIIMDDGLQNNSVEKDVNIAVFDGEEGIGNGRVIPSGPMRENLKFGLKKIKFVLIIGEDKSNISNLIKLINNKIKIFYATFEPDIKIIKAFKNKKIIAFAGIGFPNKFYNLLKKIHFNVLETKDFPDHHIYKKNELNLLIQKSKLLNATLVTTEKDYVKIGEMEDKIKKNILPFPVKLKIQKEAIFKKELQKAIHEKSK
tara:strand:- start:289 stop:1296 length:1008 start_codon:yes stop_codon:yes gene_type:complete